VRWGREADGPRWRAARCLRSTSTPRPRSGRASCWTTRPAWWSVRARARPCPPRAARAPRLGRAMGSKQRRRPAGHMPAAALPPGDALLPARARASGGVCQEPYTPCQEPYTTPVPGGVRAQARRPSSATTCPSCRTSRWAVRAPPRPPARARAPLASARALRSPARPRRHGQGHRRPPPQGHGQRAHRRLRDRARLHHHRQGRPGARKQALAAERLSPLKQASHCLAQLPGRAPPRPAARRAPGPRRSRAPPRVRSAPAAPRRWRRARWC
jgi:hypothetical protein